MIKSMTGYAEASHTKDQITLNGVFRSYNSKNLDIALYLPDNLKVFEDKVKKLVAKKVARGRVEIRFSFDETSEDSVEFSVDYARAAAYYKALDELKQKFDIKSDITLDQLLDGKKMIKPKERTHDAEALFEGLSNVVNLCLDELDKMRIKEGENLAVDLDQRFSYMEATIDLIAKKAKKLPLIYKKNLEDRISVLISEKDILDPVRVAQEVAIIADKSDISEEIVRSQSHIKQARQIMASKNSDTSVGRKLNFLVQEFNREYNTMGSKSGNVEISKMVVDLKSELEKIREQVQNIE
ncbi:MAG: YicC family protein [Desulfobacteraceae bacterium]|nr:YicC family protein [Desulfobacteraceae bacterium]